MTWRCSSCGTSNLGRHVKCTSCGDAKDASERYEMPGNTYTAKSVTDPALLKIASAGPNWQCSFCGGHQRANDGSCARCGAGRAEGRATTPWGEAASATSAAPAVPFVGDGASSRWRVPGSRRGLAIGGALAVVLLGFVGLLVFLAMPEEVDATVVGVAWEHRVHVDRWQIWSREGFDESIPSSAFERHALGERHHHDVQVLDGYDTETYTEDVACGEDCYDTPETCYESCTPDGNGFATCTESCSGGGQTCTTRYCSETRTRQVPRYHSEPVYETWYSYRIWDWGENRTVVANGTDLRTHWPPDEEVALNAGLGDGERERARRSASYRVRFRDDEEGRQLVYEPETLAELERLGPGEQRRLRIWADGTVEVIGRAGG